MGAKSVPGGLWRMLNLNINISAMWSERFRGSFFEKCLLPWRWACRDCGGKPRLPRDRRRCCLSTTPAGRWMTRLFSYSDPVCTQINTQTRWNSSQCTLPRAELHSNDTLHLDFNAAATLYLEDVRFEDVMSQFHSLLPIQLPLLAGEHESHESVSSPEVETKAERLLLCHWESTWVPSDESAVSFPPHTLALWH